MNYIYVRNEFIADNLPFLTIYDRSFRFGDGIFETILVHDQAMYNFAAHRQRLENGLKFFRINLDIAELEEKCVALLKKNNCRSGYLRIIVSRGANGVAATGYAPSADGNEACEPYYVLQTIDKEFPQFRAQKIMISKWRANLSLPCKVNSALLYTMSAFEAREAGFDNALLLDDAGNVCEAASGNIFWIKKQILYTPELSLPLIPGIIRRRIIELSPLPVVEGSYNISELMAADEIFISNVGGLVTIVSELGKGDFLAKGSSATKHIREIIEADILAYSKQKN